MKRVAVFLVATTAIARAQPLPDVRIPPDDGEPQPVPPDPVPPDDDPAIPPDPASAPDPAGDPYPPLPPPRPRREPPLIPLPEVLTTPTGWLLPAAVIYSKTSLDTGGGLASDIRVGLGDVAEFGIATTDSVRDRRDESVRASRIQPYVLATFRLGVQENRLFDGQPGMTLGFRKSFERDHDGFSTRIAELTLVASKHIGKNFAIHLGGAFWDASLTGDLDGAGGGAERETTLHAFDDVGKHQLRMFGGLEVRPLPRSQILLDLGWAPEFCYRCRITGDEITAGDHPDSNKIRLKPVLSWGVRYAVAPWMRLESGVRLPDIGEANLLEAQIFGQVTFTSFALRRTVESLK
jgi:hypothetical protein